MTPEAAPSKPTEYRQSKWQEDTSGFKRDQSSQKRKDAHVEQSGSKSKFTKKSKKPTLQCIHDQWWLYGFLLHITAYLGASAYINYIAIANNKQQITDGSGPIDTHVSTAYHADGSETLFRLCAANAIGLIAAFVVFNVSLSPAETGDTDGEIILFATNWYHWAVVGAVLLAGCAPLGRKSPACNDI